MKKLITILLVTFSASAFAADGTAEKMTPEQQKMMEAYMKAGAPGTQHEVLKKMEGTWVTAGKTWMDPKSEPQEMNGTTTSRLVLGGRFLQQEMNATSPQHPYNGMGFMGYDNLTKKFTSTWMDDMSTSQMTLEGTLDKTGKVITSTGSYIDPVTKKKKTMKTITRMETDTKHVFEIWDKAPSGKEYKSMEITYTKQ